ncbi:DUF5959 family protein [Kitasatospora sp. NPDC085464]|uniref:DUF5959 family protein n=1 Tax=Kitasatospora sp. NPDC085464 TaxID=3364063 RepID=UPI0037C81713
MINVFRRPTRVRCLFGNRVDTPTATGDKLAGNRLVSWLNSGRTVQLGIKPLRPGVIGVSIHDGPSSQVTVSLPLSPPAGWIEDHRARLENVRQVLAG